MLDIDLEDALLLKVGGKFALTSLFQKRMVELNRGAPPMVKLDPNERGLRGIVCREILEDKIALTAEDDAALDVQEPRSEMIEAGGDSESAPKEGGGEIYGSDIKKIKEQRIKELTQLLNPKKP
jgi:DNA-directed RNA polymerase subunit omega